MRELYKQLLFHMQGMWKYRWYGLMLAWLVASLMWFAVYMIPDKYEGRAQVYIDTESVLKPLLHGLAVQSDVMTEVKMMTLALLSRPNLEKVARETDLDYRAKTPRAMDELIKRLQREIRIEEGPVNFIAITYSDIDREMAKKVVQHLLNSLVEGALGSNRTDTITAQRFLREQIVKYEARLSEAEQRLAEFKKANVGMMPTEGGDYYQRLQSAMTQFERIESELKVASNRGNELRLQLEGDVPAFFGFSGVAVQSITIEEDKQIQEYQSDLNKLLLNYTKDHPDIIVLEEIIRQLKAQRSEKLAAVDDVDTRYLEKNPAFERMTSALNEAEVDIAILKGRKKEQLRKVNKLRKLVDTIPEVEAQLKRLNRDYEVTKSQYEALLQRLDSARLSEQAEESNDDIEFQVIDPVNVPLAPGGPARSLYLTFAMIAGLSAGLGLMFLLEQIRPVFLDCDRLSKTMGLPVFGRISMILTTKQRMKLRFEVTSFLVATCLLIVMYGGAVVFQDAGVHIVQSLVGSDIGV